MENVKEYKYIPSIGVITALPCEYAAVKESFDNTEEFELPGRGAGRRYALGEIQTLHGKGKHCIALALAGKGNNIASARATQLLELFPNVDSVIMVGIAGAVPHPAKPDEHVRLGDIVVSGTGGVVKYDFVKEEIDKIIPAYPPRPPSPILLEAVDLLQADKYSGNRPWEKHIRRIMRRLKAERPSQKLDILTSSDDPTRLIRHPKDQDRRENHPRVFIGNIAASDTLLKDPKKRDSLRDQFKVKAVEMEASGVADATWNQQAGYLVIRGTCDYCNPNKGDAWQLYAAIVAAAYMRALIESLPVKSTPGPQILTTSLRETASDSTEISTSARPFVPRPEVSVSRLVRSGKYLVGRTKDLRKLSRYWANPRINVVSIIGFGGVGKSALVNHWRGRMALDNYRGAEKVFGWSFSSQGTQYTTDSAESFIEAALTFFADESPTMGWSWEKGQRLANLIRQNRTLLILDGIEPLQHPPGPFEGKIKDPGLQTLIMELADWNLGLCIITSRTQVEDIADLSNTTAPIIDLGPLSDDAGAILLEYHGVRGLDTELHQASNEFSGHPLALRLLGTYLRDVCEGDVRRRSEVSLIEQDEELEGQAKRIMATYDKLFSSKDELTIEQALLRIVGLFNRPAQKEWIEELRSKPIIKGLTDPIVGLTDVRWRRTLARLRRAQLLSEDTGDGSLDAHPLIREYFGAQIRRHRFNCWTEAHSRLYEHCKLKAEEYPNSIQKMSPLFAAVHHGCQSQRHSEALEDVYIRRILKNDEQFSLLKLGAIGSTLAALSGFFERPWSQPVSSLTLSGKAFVLRQAGFYLRALARLREAVEPMMASLQAYNSRRSFKDAAESASYISELYLMLGELARSAEYATKSFELAEKSEDNYMRAYSRTTLGDVLHHLGRLGDALVLFSEAERLLTKEKTSHHFLYYVAGFRYCDLLLSLGEHQEAIKRAQWTIKRELRPLGIALDHISLGRAYQLAVEESGHGDFTLPEFELSEAVNKTRQAGHLDDLPRALIARANLYLAWKKFDKAEIDLAEAKKLSEIGEMGIHLVDCYIEYARLHVGKGNIEIAHNRLCEAKRLIVEMAYKRQNKIVEQLEKQIKNDG